MAANVFTYGSLMLAEVFEAVTGLRPDARPAQLDGYERFALVGADYPGMVASPGQRVDGVVWERIDRTTLALLDRFEDDLYRRTTVQVTLGRRQRMQAQAWVVADVRRHRLTPLPWDAEAFRRDKLAAYLQDCRQFRTWHAGARTIVAAGGDDLAALSELALRSKAVWGYDEDFLAACRAELTLTPARIEGWYLRRLLCDCSVAGFVAVSFAGGRAELEMLFVEPDAMETGVGRALLADAAAEARRRGAATLGISADPDAAGFYQAMGARPVGDEESASVPGRMLPRLELDLSDAP
jgi:gamma-glutamylcyclotransferase (GGCT)/AIG2-like uncharacterized protein YtfP